MYLRQTDPLPKNLYLNKHMCLTSKLGNTKLFESKLELIKEINLSNILDTKELFDLYKIKHINHRHSGNHFNSLTDAFGEFIKTTGYALVILKKSYLHYAFYMDYDEFAKELKLTTARFGLYQSVKAPFINPNLKKINIKREKNKKEKEKIIQNSAFLEGYTQNYIKVNRRKIIKYINKELGKDFSLNLPVYIQ